MNGWGISSFKALLVRFCPDPICFCGALEPPFEDIAEANHHDHHDQLWWKQSWWTRPQETAARWLGAPAPSATSTSRPTSSPPGAFPETQHCGLRDAGSHLSDGCPWRCQTSAWDGAASAHGHPADASDHGAMWDAHPRTTGLRCSTWMWWLHVALTWAPSHWEACVLGCGNSDLEAVGAAVPLRNLRSGPHNHSWRVISIYIMLYQLYPNLWRLHEVTIVIPINASCSPKQLGLFSWCAILAWGSHQTDIQQAGEAAGHGFCTVQQGHVITVYYTMENHGKPPF